MRFFHLSDLHIGLRLYNRSLEEDQRYVFRQIVKMAEKEQPDAVLIAGDVYDKAVPSAESVELFDEFLTGLAEAAPEAEIMIISGNHDSAPRLNAFRGLLKRQKIHMIGQPPRKPEERIEKVTLTDGFGEVHFYLLPYVRPSMVREAVAGEDEGSLSYEETLRRLIQRENVDTDARNVLVSHQFYLPSGTDAAEMDRMESEICTVGNIDQVSCEVLEPFDYAALGHIHKPMSLRDARFRYCGTPLACSVSEAGQQKGMILAELGETGHLSTRVLPLCPLREVRILSGGLHEILAQASEDYVSVRLTGAEEGTPDTVDRLRAAFPNLLEIRRISEEKAAEGEAFLPEAAPDPLELCRLFLGGLEEEEEALLQDVIREVQENGWA